MNLVWPIFVSALGAGLGALTTALSVIFRWRRSKESPIVSPEVRQRAQKANVAVHVEQTGKVTSITLTGEAKAVSGIVASGIDSQAIRAQGNGPNISSSETREYPPGSTA